MAVGVKRAARNIALVVGGGLLCMLLAFGAHCVVLPRIDEDRIRTFCDGVRVGEEAKDVWNRGSRFERVRGASTTREEGLDRGSLPPDGTERDLDFSVSLPSLFIRVWHCHVSVEPRGVVAGKTLSCED